jgi:soluble lytic murein transglycosylase
MKLRKNPALNRAVVLTLLCSCLMVDVAHAQVENMATPARKPQYSAPVTNVSSIIDAASRNAAVQGLKHIERKEWEKARQVMLATKSKLVHDLYHWMAYTRDYGKPRFEDVAQFIQVHPDWPRARTVQLTAEKVMPKDWNARHTVDWFDRYAPQTADGMDRYLQGLIALGRTDQATKVFQNWWPNATLTSDQQDRLLRSHIKLNATAVNANRIGHLIARERYTDARSLARFMGRGYPALVEARIALSRGSSDANALVSQVPAHLKDDPGLMYERLRWRRKNDLDVGAVEILHKQPAANKITNPTGWWHERNIIIRRLLDKKQFKSAYMVAASHRHEKGVPFVEAEFLAGWIALQFINEPWKAFEHFERLYHNSETALSKSRGAYWAGMASLKLGHKDIADQWLRVAARHQTTFYGQMAVGALDQSQKPPQQTPPTRTAAGEAQFLAHDLVQISKILHSAGMWRETTTFLDAVASNSNDPETVMLTAELSKSLDHHHNALNIAKRALQNNIMITDYAFPTMLNLMKNVDVEWALVHGLIRQESAFDIKARSGVGASGLMQLMPATATETAKKAGIPHSQEWLTTKPDHNVRLGSLYLKRMLARYDNNYALALAAYNAGPGRVDRWLVQFGDPRKGEISLIDWIEMIPFTETRNYVQRVLESVYVYRLKIGTAQATNKAPIHVKMK